MEQLQAIYKIALCDHSIGKKMKYLALSWIILQINIASGNYIETNKFDLDNEIGQDLYSIEVYNIVHIYY